MNDIQLANQLKTYMPPKRDIALLGQDPMHHILKLNSNPIINPIIVEIMVFPVVNLKFIDLIVKYYI